MPGSAFFVGHRKLATRSLALRERGLAVTSSGSASTGFFVMIFQISAWRKAHLTMRSSRE